MKILIVDDNANNRMILNLFLQDFAEGKKKDSCEIQECENGLVALNKVKETKYDLIFMDIMMPEMDGIEATKKIRAHDKEVMIIAVSAVDDELKKKEILRCGAEDYVSKPIIAEQLFDRLDNYFALSKLRHHGNLSAHRKAANLYTKAIFKRQTIFYVTSEETLSEFWEYYLLGNGSSKVDNLSDVVRVIFALGEEIVKLDGEPWILVEEDENAIYFTINRIDVIGEAVMKLVMKKNNEVTAFKFDNEKISFRLEKNITPLESDLAPLKDTPQKVITAAEEKAEEKTVKDIEIAVTDINSYKIFNYMDPDDLNEIEELVGDLNSLILMLGSSTLDESEVGRIAALLESIGSRLTIYTESYAIGQALTRLSQEISSHIDRFQEIANDLSTLSAAFIADLQSWLKMTFYKGAPSVDFMNDTIVANAQTISAMLAEDEVLADTGEMDDIFDF